MTDIVQQIEDALEGMTPGEWGVAGKKTIRTVRYGRWALWIAKVFWHNPHDAAGIVTLRNLTPALVAEVKRLREENERLREALKMMLSAYSGEDGFAAAVRLQFGMALPWPSGDRAEAAARAALEPQP